MYKKSKSSTQHGIKTPYGVKTPHRLPIKTSNLEDLMRLVSQLYPTGRAWYLPENGVFRNFHESINVSFLRILNNSYDTLNSSFPDNEFFNENDCQLWEYRLGLPTNLALDLNQRKLIILNKMGYPRNIRVRQGIDYIKSELQNHGFNVGVYENIFYDVFGNVQRKLPFEIIASSISLTQHGGGTEHGESTQHGAGNYEVIANSMFDEDYSIGGTENLWATFFIAGPNNISDFANIPSGRKNEFKELVLKLKPAHLVAFTFINY